MIRRVFSRPTAAMALLVLASACNVFNTRDSENARGRGQTAFDPYGINSGAIRLSLQMINGCHVLANGTPVVKGDVDFDFDYPEKCRDLHVTGEFGEIEPTGKFRLLTNTTYFLNQLTLIDAVVNHPDHMEFTDHVSPAKWIREESRFKNLDWTDMGVTLDDYEPATSGPPVFNREVMFGNAKWQQDKEHSFLVEVLDTSGTVRSSAVYDWKDFLATNHQAGHTRFSWKIEDIYAPLFPGDTSIRYPESVAGPTFRTTARLDMFGSTNPFKGFRVEEGLQGDGAIRVTWSLLPNEPFMFPVTFVSAENVASECYQGEDDSKPVPCGFGLQPKISFSPPANGQGFYEPGEKFEVFFALADGAGNRLHRKDALKSYKDYYADQTNGLLYLNPGLNMIVAESDGQQSFKLMGPLNEMRQKPDINEIPNYFQFPANVPNGPAFDHKWPSPYASYGTVADTMTMEWPTRYPITLPADAKPGTYLAVLKSHRQFLGERGSVAATAMFQVGQPEPTEYPNRVGNCQICHRGVVSMENLRHGISVDHVESCKGCHSNGMNLAHDLHQLHMLSDKYPADKNDCTMCHLTRESTLTPTFEVCSSCHPTPHGEKYFALKHELINQPNRFSNCAESCHGSTVPAGHLVPPN